MFDVVFNPEVITRCSHPKFKDMVVETAIDGVCNNFKVTLDRGSKKFPKMKFKGTPSSCVIRKRVGEVSHNMSSLKLNFIYDSSLFAFKLQGPRMFFMRHSLLHSAKMYHE